MSLQKSLKDLAIHCRYFAIEGEADSNATDITGYAEVRGWTDSRTEPCGQSEYSAGTISADLWDKTWADWANEGQQAFFWVDFIYFGA
jgi:hypothetical protein